MLLLSVYRVWIATDGPTAARGTLPSWPLPPDDDTLGIVIGETHHPVQAKESSRPGWLTIHEKGLFTGLAIFGAVGSGKTSACMYPFAQQIFSWQAKNPPRRGAGSGSQGRLLPLHSEDACRSRAGARLHGDRPYGPLAMESPRSVMARFVLVGLYDIEPLKSIVRERERTLLAAGLPLIHSTFEGPCRLSFLPKPRPLTMASSPNFSRTASSALSTSLPAGPNPLKRSPWITCRSRQDHGHRCRSGGRPGHRFRGRVGVRRPGTSLLLTAWRFSDGCCG